MSEDQIGCLGLSGRIEMGDGGRKEGRRKGRKDGRKVVRQEGLGRV